MNSQPLVSLRHNTALRDFVVFAGLVLTWIGTDLAWSTVSASSHPWAAFVPADTLLHGGPARSFRKATTYLLPGLAAGCLWLLVRVSRQGGADRFPKAAAGGSAFIVGGAAFDLSSTVAINPELTLEGNPYVRSLIESGHSLPFVYMHAGLTQAGYVTLFCVLWLTFLRHLPVLKETIVAAAPSTGMGFLKAATGGAHLTMRQWLFPIRSSELPHVYHGVWAMVISVVFGISLFRWYVALEWLDVIPPTAWARAAVIGVGLVGSLIAYFLALWRLSVPGRGMTLSTEPLGGTP